MGADVGALPSNACVYSPCALLMFTRHAAHHRRFSLKRSASPTAGTKNPVLRLRLNLPIAAEFHSHARIPDSTFQRHNAAAARISHATFLAALRRAPGAPDTLDFDARLPVPPSFFPKAYRHAAERGRADSVADKVGGDVVTR